MRDLQQREEDLMACVHCGLCLTSCPTYLETGSEADSPRGRIAIMRALHESRVAATDPGVAEHLDRCLGCRACETACPSGVPYGNLIETARAQLREAGAHSRATEMARGALLSTLTNSTKLTAAVRVGEYFGGNLPGLAANILAGKPPLAPNPPQFSMPARVESSFSHDAATGGTIPAQGAKRARVSLLTGCVMHVLYAGINDDTARVLAANGCETLIRKGQGCCGALHLHNGYPEEARRMAADLVTSFAQSEGSDAIITNSAGCGSVLKEYGALLAGNQQSAAPSTAFAHKVRDICEFLDDLGWAAPLQMLPEGAVTVAYHDACHLAHGQGIRDAPRRLLSLIPGVTLVPLTESEICCGSAGIYNLTEPEMARKLQDRKIDRILDTGATVVAAGNPGCLAWIEGGMKTRGKEVRVVHPVTLLAEALAS